MLLGFYLLNHFDILKELNYDEVLQQMGSDSNPKVDEIKQIIKPHQSPLWCLVSLSHDLGYPIEKTKKANQIISNMISNFGFLNVQQLLYDFTIVHQTAIQQLLKTLSSVIFYKGLSYKIATYPGASLDFAKSFENLDHGIMSAFLLQKHLDCICETPYFENIDHIFFTDVNQAAQFISFTTLLSSISAHTSKFRYSHGFNNMNALLFIADEVEEFSRYARSKTTHEWVNLKCRTQVALSKDKFNVYFTFDNKNISESFHIEDFFKAKVEKLHYKFEVYPDSIQQVSIQCTDLTKSSPLDYIYTRDTKSTELITPSRTIKDQYTELLNYISKS